MKLLPGKFAVFSQEDSPSFGIADLGLNYDA